MVNHVGMITETFELNGHEGYEHWNATTQTYSILCGTCPGRNGGSLLLHFWRPRRRGRHDPLAFVQHANPLNHPTRGQRYDWEGLTYTVTRVSEAGRWADIKVAGPDGWTKRQPLPLPPGSSLATPQAVNV